MGRGVGTQRGRSWGKSSRFAYPCTAPSALPFPIPKKELCLTLKHLHGRLGVQQKRGRLWTSDCARKGMATNNQNQVKQSKAKTQSKTKTPPVFCPLLLKRLQGFAFCQKQKATTTTKITWWFLSSIRTKASYLML